jgi:hypothetical protein
MPALRIWWHNTNLAADDLPIPAAMCAVVHLACIAFCVVDLVGFHGDTSRHDSVEAYMACLLIICTAGFVLECLIFHHARQGVHLAMVHCFMFHCSMQQARNSV